MIGWIVLIIVNVGCVAAAVHARRNRKRLGRLLVAFVALLVLGGPIGAVASVVRLRLAFGEVGGTAVDPSQKARVLAEGIAEAMNLVAFGVVAFLVPAIATLVLFLRAPKTAPQ